MADRTLVQATLTGVSPGFANASAGGDRFKPGSAAPVFIAVRNTDASPLVVNIEDTTSVPPTGLTFTASQLSVSVPATNGERVIKISNPGRFTDENGWINITYGSSPTATLAIFA
jgi:hypothetical protein